MQEDLRRCNYLGDIESIYLFSKMALVDYDTDIISITNMCVFNSQINVKPKPCILFFREIGLIRLNDTIITRTQLGGEIAKKDIEQFVRKVAELTLNYLLDNEYVELDSISYDIDSARCIVKRSAFPLTVAVMRNFLIDAGMLVDRSPAFYELNSTYELFFENSVKVRKKVLSLEKLKDIQLAQEMQGRQAEEYVVDFEKRRLEGHMNIEEVKQISDFDVSAGFDIVSFESIESENIDRFIEVKSFHKSPHFFWSANEYAEAQLRGIHYYIYLVDMDHYLEKDYVPIIICNPSEKIMKESEWLVKPASYEITHI